MEKKTIAVVGATGAQGGGLVRAILADPQGGFGVRALTRDPSTEKARALAAAGAEVVAANVDDVDSLRRAFTGAYGAYCVTFFWDHMSPEREQDEARRMVQAAKDARREARHLVDARGHAEVGPAHRLADAHAARQVQGPALRREGRGEPLLHRGGLPMTLLNTSFYWDNLIHFGMGPKKGPDGKLRLRPADG